MVRTFDFVVFFHPSLLFLLHHLESFPLLSRNRFFSVASDLDDLSSAVCDLLSVRYRSTLRLSRCRSPS